LCRARRRRRRRIFSFCRTQEEEEFSAFAELEDEEAAQVKKAAKSGIFSIRTSQACVSIDVEELDHVEKEMSLQHNCSNSRYLDISSSVDKIRNSFVCRSTVISCFEF